METNTPVPTKNRKPFYIIGALILIAAVAAGAYSATKDRFCFDFAYDTQFGEKKGFTKASNIGIPDPKGEFYYVPEVPALQTALEKEGFSVDEYEKTGGGIYLTSFFGPSTRSAVIAFQEKHDLAPTGIVDNNMIEALRSRYGCTEPVKPEMPNYR